MIALEKLDATHDLSAFFSGNDQLDGWIRKNGLGNQHRYGVTYVAMDQQVVVGFVTVSASAITRAQLGGGGGPGTWPVLLLARMAVAVDRQGTGLGRILVAHVFKLALQQHMTVGCAAIIVDAKPGAVGFYEKYMFKPTRAAAEAPPSAQTTMYVAMKTILDAMMDE